MKLLIALMLAAVALGGGAYWYVSSGQGSHPPAIRVDVKEGNGNVTVSWTRVNSSGGVAVTGYKVVVEPAGTDRVPPPRLVTPPAERVPAAESKPIAISGLLEDCHQLYKVAVTPETNAGPGPTSMSRVFRPSGIVKPGRPPYVVILLDGIGEFKPGFKIDPYDPTNKGETPSYCPENVRYMGQMVPNDFPHEPNGPWEFFRKWNFYDPSDTANENDPEKSSNSTPRDLSDPSGQALGAETHTFMLDAIAGTGGVILPFSYNGAALTGSSRHPQFTFPAYTACNSSPGGLGGPGCDRDPGGEPDPVSVGATSWRISQDERNLAQEVASVRNVWGNVRIVVVGHSQGGLIAFDAWRDGLLPGILHGFSLDSPINGVCSHLHLQLPTGPIYRGCVGPAGYNSFEGRFDQSNDPQDFRLDGGGVFRFIGTWGDEVPITHSLVADGPAYGVGDETLQHELLVIQNRPCVTAANNAGCPSPPDEISTWPGTSGTNECKIPDRGWARVDQHFIVKFCPGNVNYFNTVLGLSSDQAGPRSPCSNDTFLGVVRDSYASSYIHSLMGVGQPACVDGYAEEDFAPYAGGQQAPFFFNEVSPGKWNLIEGGNTDVFPAACSTIPPAIMAKLGFGCPTPQAQSCSIPGGAEGGADLPFTTTDLSCADGTRLIRAVIAGIPNYGSAWTSPHEQDFACQLTPPAGYPPGSPVSPGWQVTCTKGAETLEFELPG